MQYRRARVAGGCYFFTVVTRDRCKLFVDEFSVSVLRSAFRTVMVKRPFVINAAVVLPDHIHCVWTLPAGDADFSTRWRLIKAYVTQRLSDYAATRLIRPTGNNRVGRSVWQHRYWEHLMHDESDYSAHIDYIHFNPVKHGYVSRPVDWPYSSIHRYVADGQMPEDWGANGLDLQENTGRE